MVEVDDDGYGHSLARTYTLTTHKSHTQTLCMPWWFVNCSTQKREIHTQLTSHTLHACPLMVNHLLHPKKGNDIFTHTVYALGVSAPVRLF